MSRIYISSSWSNAFQPTLVQQLREQGHKVYDFRHPEGRNDRNVWEELGVNKQSMTGSEFEAAVSDPDAMLRFNKHYDAMQDADSCILLLPCGRSSHIEAGIMRGLGKRVLVYDSGSTMIPEFMYRALNGYYHGEDGLQELFHELQQPIYGVCQVCGCSDNNPCFHPEHGTCWWVDEEHTLCSHCAHQEEEGEYSIADDPETVHCINDKSNAFR